MMMSGNKFKLGDKVKIINVKYTPALKEMARFIGKVGTITCVNFNISCGITFEDENSQWYFNLKSIEHLPRQLFLFDME